MSGGQISWPRLVGGWMLIKDTPAAQCKITDELAQKSQIEINFDKIENGTAREKLAFFFFTMGIDTLDCMV